jgi:hypothetical protein
MPRYRLRSLLILLAIGPPLLAGAWLGNMAQLIVATIAVAPFIPAAIIGVIAARSERYNPWLCATFTMVGVAGAIASSLVLYLSWLAPQLWPKPW